MTSAREALLARLAEVASVPERRRIASSIVDFESRDALVDRVIALTERLAGSAPCALLHASFSMGAVFGWALEDGTRVLLKQHPRQAALAPLEASYALMDALAAIGFPCPMLRAGPLDDGGALVVLMGWLDASETPPSSTDAELRARACAFARLVRVGSANPHAGALARAPGLAKPWPPPHSPVFDFEASREGAEAIDAIGAWTADALTARNPSIVVAHADWTAHNVWLDGDAVSAVYDWDSLHREDHAVSVGVAALASGFDTRRAFAPPPTAAWVEGFIRAYRDASDALSDDDARAAKVAALRTYAYLARCQHALAWARRADAPYPFAAGLERFARELDARREASGRSRRRS